MWREIVGIYFERHRENSCCLCGATENLTGEHKIKASAIKVEFGKDEMFIGNADFPQAPGKYAQSPKSKALHFVSRLCADCNGARTQGADKEFDRLHSVAREMIENGVDPSLAFNDCRYKAGSPAYLNVFRYFAKLLCCHMAEVGAPRLIHMSKFGIGLSNFNCISLQVREDWTYQQLSQFVGKQQYAAHGGLTVLIDRKTNAPHRFHSTLTLGPLQYVFFTNLNWFQCQHLKYFHHSFCVWARNQVTNAPESDAKRFRLGLSNPNPGTNEQA